MPLLTPPSTHGGRRTFARGALVLCCALLVSAQAIPSPAARTAPGSVPGTTPRIPRRSAPLPASSSNSPYDRALRLREALEGRSEAQRSRRDYDRVLDAFRAVYHTNPRDPHADASVAAVAELLAEEGRLFEDHKASLDAIGEYEFLRRAYPGSRRRESALLTEGEIYRHDLEDRANARGTFANFLRLYPRSPLADEARQGLKGLPAAQPMPAAAASRSSTHHNAVLDAALASQASRATPSRDPEARPSTRAAPSAGTSVASAPASAPATQPVRRSSQSSQSSQSSRDTLVEQDLPSTPVDTASATRKPETSRSSAPSAARVPDRVVDRTEASSAPSVPLAKVPVYRTPPPASGQEPAPSATLSDAAMNATPPPRRRGKLPLVTGVRHWSTSDYTRVAIDLEDEVQYQASRAPNPDRIFFDLHGARLSPELIGKAITVTDGGYLKRIRAAQFSDDVVRVVLDVSNVSDYSAFFLPNPSRLIIDIHGTAAAPVQSAEAPPVRAAPRTKSSQALVTPGTQAAASAPASPTPARTQAARANLNAAPPAAAPTTSGGALGDIATLDRQPNTVRATRQPTTAPVSVSVPDTVPAPQPTLAISLAPDTSTRKTRAASTLAGKTTRDLPPADASAPAIHAPEVRAAVPTAAGERSMVRALGLKIGRIVVDAGHGGHDSGTLGPEGIEEKNVVLDVALRLGKLLKQRLGADVIYTRDDDTFIPLETRTAIANKAQADLFISVHANSSQDASARGVETYYLNFTTSADALEVAARENAVSDQSIHQLSDLVRKITLQDKIAESREFAGDVEQSLYTGLQSGNPGLKDRGVKKAPFVVLIGANMPSILAEISFLTNPDDAHELRDPEYRQRIAESLYRGVAKYIGSLSGVRLADGGSRPAGQ